jgi:hypothetical protein
MEEEEEDDDDDEEEEHPVSRNPGLEGENHGDFFHLPVIGRGLQ